MSLQRKCHAHDLVELVDLVFPADAFTVSVQSTSTTDDSIPVAAHGSVDKSYLFDGDSNHSIPPPPRWPDAWIQLVENIRSCKYGMFRELMSGCGTLSTAFSHKGWTCAPVVSPVICSDFCIGNHFFLSIVLAVVLEGRITLSHNT